MWVLNFIQCTQRLQTPKCLLVTWQVSLCAEATQPTCSLSELYPAVKVPLNWPSVVIYRLLFLFPLTHSEVWLRLQGADLLSSVGFSTVRAASTRLWKNHTWWELWNNAASGMFPRWPAGSDGGPTGRLVGFMGNVTHTYRVTWSNASCVSLHLDLFLSCRIKSVLCVGAFQRACTGFI